jgi:hypothetical protein
MSRIINEKINGKFSQSGLLKSKKSVYIIKRRDRDPSEGYQWPVNPAAALIAFLHQKLTRVMGRSSKRKKMVLSIYL